MLVRYPLGLYEVDIDYVGLVEWSTQVSGFERLAKLACSKFRYWGFKFAEMLKDSFNLISCSGPTLFFMPFSGYRC